MAPEAPDAELAAPEAPAAPETAGAMAEPEAPAALDAGRLVPDGV